MPCPASRPCASYFPSKESRAYILYHSFTPLHKMIFPFDTIKTIMMKIYSSPCFPPAYIYASGPVFPVFLHTFSIYVTVFIRLFTCSKRSGTAVCPPGRFVFPSINILHKNAFASKIVDSKICRSPIRGAVYGIKRKGISS